MNKFADFMGGMAWFAVGLWSAWYSVLGLVVDWPFFTLVISMYMSVIYSHKIGLNLIVARFNAVVLTLIIISYLIFYFTSFRGVAMGIACDSGIQFHGVFNSIDDCAVAI